MNTSNSPIFIIGVHRSGTTLLRFMLSSHSKIYIPPESDFIPLFFQKTPTGNLSFDRTAELLNNIFARYRFIGEWKGSQPEASDFYNGMQEKTPAAFLDRLYSLYAHQFGAVRWGDKTPIYASYVRLIHIIFPNARFIHIIRDPRDAAVSLLEKYAQREFHIDIYFAARNWVRRIMRARNDGFSLGPNFYFEIRYENLVTNPDRELRAICNFINEDYEPQMQSHHDLASKNIPEDSHFFENVRKPVNNESIGRWMAELSLNDQRVIQRVSGDLMRELGYPTEDLGKMSGTEHLRFQFLQTKYATLQTGRHILQTLGFFPPI